MRKKVLWIEDGAFNEITVLAAPVHLAGEYQLEFAFSATEGIDQLKATEFDVVVVDIRIPPGDDDRWVRIHYDGGSSNKAARLGLKLLLFVLGAKSEWNSQLPAAARDPSRYGVLSMESWSDLQEHLAPVGVTIHRDKGAGENTEALLEIIHEILAGRGAGGNGASDVAG